MYYLRQLEDEKKIPVLPVYVDSPMALSATDLYVKYKEDHDLDFSRLESSGDGDPLNVHEFHLTRSSEESKAINSVKTPCIIVSASGMVSGGRVLHHLAQRLPDAKNAVVLAGFQAEGTRGRALQEGAKVLHLQAERFRSTPRSSPWASFPHMQEKVNSCAGSADYSRRRKRRG
jgi:metallo-beta-lactamase family protein